MLLIDALYVNNGGGKILLNYLIENLEKSNIQVYYLLDQRLKFDRFFIKDTNTVLFLKPSLISRYFFYKKNSNLFSKVLCFGNIPPSIKLTVETYTFFQQALFIEIPSNTDFFKIISINLKVFVLKQLKKNTRNWIVQSQNVKNGLVGKYKLNSSHVHLIPFYPPLKNLNFKFRSKNSYIFVSDGWQYKNHNALLDAFCLFYDHFKIGQLLLTISDKFINLTERISNLQKMGYPIVNLGILKRDDLAAVYSQVEFLVFPSLVESFGLGIVEAIENGCKIIGADLPYMHAICKPSIIFNPNCTYDIFTAFVESLNPNVKDTIPKVKNEIQTLINILK